MNFPRNLLCSFTIIAALVAGACGAAEDATEATPTTEVDGQHVLTGDVTVRGADEISHLPEGARIVIQLRDISLQDAASVLIAEATSTSTTIPLSYELRWDTDLEAGRDYSVSASVYDGEGQLLFTSDTVHSYQPGDDGITVELISV